MRGLKDDLKVACRNIRRKQSFSLMVVAMLTLGIAGNAAVFSIFNGLFLRPLPFPEADRLIDVDETAPKWNLKYVGISSADSYEWHKSNSSFDSIAFFRGKSYNLSDGGTAHRVTGAQVSREMLDVLGLKPAVGRNFLPVEDRPGGAKVVLLSYPLWQGMFQSDRNVLGRVIKLDEESYTVVGVLPRAAVFPDRTELWTPLAADPNTASGYYLSGVGRLKREVSIQQAKADLMRIHKAMIARGSKINEITSPILTALRDRYLGDLRTVSRVLMAAVAVVLLIVCVNIAALMMVRGSFRSREIAIRTAIGASRGRIVAQLLTENVVLAVAGAGFGVILGTAWLGAMIRSLPQVLPQWVAFSLDGRFAVFCVAITTAATLLFGLIPSLQTSRADIRGRLQDSGARTTLSRGGHAMLGALVAGEVALALILSLSSGLLLGAFRKVMQIDPGFRPENVLTFQVSIPDSSYDKPEKKVTYYRALLSQLRTLPGVKAAGATSAPPLGGHWGGQFEGEGSLATAAQGENPEVLRVAATPGYFDAMGMTLVDGRTFDELDNQPMAARVVLVNETFAKHFWGRGSPVGKRIRELGGKDWYQVIGLLRDEKHDGLDQRTTPGVFHPYAPTMLRVNPNDARALRIMTIAIRSSIDPKMLANSARQVLRQLDADVPMYNVYTMTEKLDQSLWARRAYSWLFGAFAMIAISLAAAGVYGVVSYAVGQRIQEIGIRMALGARPAQVLAHVLKAGMTLVAIGLAAGLAISMGVIGLLRSLLFGVGSHDPFIYSLVVAAVLVIGLLANLFPARRAARVDPMRALHFE